MARPPLKEGDDTLIIPIRLERSTYDLCREVADRSGLTISAVMRSFIRDHVYARHSVATLPRPALDRADKRRRSLARSEAARTIPLPPDPDDHPVAFLASLRQPAEARHQWSAQPVGPPRCVVCDAAPGDRSRCR
jgi:hypothetical protein